MAVVQFVDPDPVEPGRHRAAAGRAPEPERPRRSERLARDLGIVVSVGTVLTAVAVFAQSAAMLAAALAVDAGGLIYVTLRARRRSP